MHTREHTYTHVITHYIMMTLMLQLHTYDKSVYKSMTVREGLPSLVTTLPPLAKFVLNVWRGFGVDTCTLDDLVVQRSCQWAHPPHGNHHRPDSVLLWCACGWLFIFLLGVQGVEHFRHPLRWTAGSTSLVPVPVEPTGEVWRTHFHSGLVHLD